MQLAINSSKNYAFLPSGILIIDPDSSLLAARTLLLTAADQYVTASSDEVAGKELCKIEVTIAILSQTLGLERLQTLASEIRLHWPNARILLLSNEEMTLDDRLYDNSINCGCRPEQLLHALHWLRKEACDGRGSSRIRIGSCLHELNGMSLRRVPSEIDPSKQPIPPSENLPNEHDVPADEHG